MLNEDIKAAYDEIHPDEIARARMLEAILTKNKDQTEPIKKGLPSFRAPKWLVGTLGAMAAVWLVIALPQPKTPKEPEVPDRPLMQATNPQPERPLMTAKPPMDVPPPADDALPESLEWEGHTYFLEKGTTIPDAELGGELAPHDGGALRSLRNREACQAVALVTPDGNYLYQRTCEKEGG